MTQPGADPDQAALDAALADPRVKDAVEDLVRDRAFLTLILSTVVAYAGGELRVPADLLKEIEESDDDVGISYGTDDETDELVLVYGPRPASTESPK